MTSRPTGLLPQATGTVRVATFNASLFREEAGRLVEDLASPGHPQADAVAEIVQRVRPDVLLVNELDHVSPARPGDTWSTPAVDALRRNYLAVPHGDARPLHYPHAYVAPSNTGVPTGIDLDGDGAVDGPGDAFGFGRHPGQYGMAVLSRYPIDRRRVRTFRLFRWSDMPGALLPDDPDRPGRGDWYSPQARAVLRLSSKSHWDVPVRVGRRAVHLLASHPTPPAFDGPEQRNVRRNHDEIRLWADYVAPGRGRYLYDDAGRRGGLPTGASFVVAGDLNADPSSRGSSLAGAIRQLLDLRVVRRGAAPTSPGAAEVGDPGDTADLAGGGTLRLDYVLPSWDLRVAGSGVFWPASGDPLAALTGPAPFPSSDHRLVYVDVRPWWPFRAATRPGAPGTDSTGPPPSP